MSTKLDVGWVANFSVGAKAIFGSPEVREAMGGMTITAVDRAKGTITVDRAAVVDAEYKRATRALSETMWANSGAPLAKAQGGELPPLTPAGAMALLTFAGLEFLRQRKNEIAQAEQSGDYSSLIAEFVQWLKALVAAWRSASR